MCCRDNVDVPSSWRKDLLGPLKLTFFEVLYLRPLHVKRAKKKGRNGEGKGGHICDLKYANVGLQK